ncbi:MAG: hypothetical protein WD648_06790 [Planctomycetaceae bacterium]
MSRILEGYALDGSGPRTSLRLASLYVDQFPQNDISRAMAKKHGVPLADSIEGALTLGTGKLAVDGVLIVAEHGSYPLSVTEQTVYPKRRMFTEVVKVFEKSGRVVPVFSDKHLADNWTDAKWIYDKARELNIPLMAGSSVPSYRRLPEANVARGRPLKEIVATAYGPVEAYGFHVLELLQCLAERRRGDETGVRRVQFLAGQRLWDAARDNVFDVQLLNAALARGIPDFDPTQEWREKVKEPAAFVVDYNDGLRASVFLLSRLTEEFSAAWRYADDGQVEATRFALQNERPYTHFAFLLQGIERMMQSGEPSWPAERTLMTTGMLHAAMQSKLRQGVPVATPHLAIRYHSDWEWMQPPAP